MNKVYTAALEVQRFFKKKRWRSCIIGGLAVIRWGNPRATKDVDFTLLLQLKDQRRVVQQLLEKFQPRIEDAEEFARRNRVLLCNASNGIEIDLALAASGFEQQVVERSSSFKYAPRCTLVTASAEDLVVLKAISDRSLDWTDLEGVIVRQKGRLNWNYILESLAPLCELKEDDRPLQQLESLRRRLEKPTK